MPFAVNKINLLPATVLPKPSEASAKSCISASDIAPLVFCTQAIIAFIELTLNCSAVAFSPGSTIPNAIPAFLILLIVSAPVPVYKP